LEKELKIACREVWYMEQILVLHIHDFWKQHDKMASSPIHAGEKREYQPEPRTQGGSSFAGKNRFFPLCPISASLNPKQSLADLGSGGREAGL
jgi:hypothetical protein